MQLKNRNNPNKYLYVFIFSTVIILAILFLRNYLTENTTYNFLLWNLFLGIIPFIVTFALKSYFDKVSNLILWIGCGIWLLFYPNSPYMITDLIHINQIPEIASTQVLVYDTIIIFSFAMLAAFYGFYSMGMVYYLVRARTNKFIANFIIMVSILLSSFGIYLGRFVRLNSWDVFTKPIQTIALILHKLYPLAANKDTYIFLFLFSFLQMMLLSLIIDIRQTDNE
jgi:uncharacterized membrane protein